MTAKKHIFGLALCALFLLPAPARAQYVLCEDPKQANTDMQDLASDAIDMFGDFITEIGIFIDNDLGQTARTEMLDRLDQYDTALYPPMADWWHDSDDKTADITASVLDDGDDSEGDGAFGKTGDNGGDGDCSASGEDGSDYVAASSSKKAHPDCIDGSVDGKGKLKYPATSTLPEWKAMIRQLSIAKIDQTRMIGSMVDARIINEHIIAKQQAQVDARDRFTPPETTCTMDMAGPAMNKMYYLARALTRTITREDTLRRLNYLRPQPEIATDDGVFIRSAHAAPPPRGAGGMAEISTRFNTYAQLYCDPTIGDPGCDAAYIAANPTRPNVGDDADVYAFIAGDKQTLDFTQAPERNAVAFALQTLVDPFAPEPLSRSMLNGSQGLQAMTQRRTYNARINAVYNVLSQMIGERAAMPTKNVLGGTDANGKDVDPPKDADGNVIDVVGKINADMGLGGTDKDGNVVPPPDGDNTSYASLRNALAKSRYLNPAYITKLVSTPAAVVQEQSDVNATQAQLFNDLLKREEEMLFMEAASYADDLDHNMPQSADSARQQR